MSKGLKGLTGQMKCINIFRKGSAAADRRMFPYELGIHGQASFFWFV